MQSLNVKSLNSKETSITHTSRYLSGQKFRDNFMYAPFHEKLTDEFYQVIEADILKK